MFNNNKYYQWYFVLIDKAKSRQDLIEHTETHHIVPKSIGGSNDEENLVELTPREHFVAHLLLPKILKSVAHQNKMYCALNHFKKFFTSRQYSLFRVHHA